MEPNWNPEEPVNETLHETLKKPKINPRKPKKDLKP